MFHLFIYLFIYLFLLLRATPRHMEVPRLGVQSELQPPAYTTATATGDLSLICDLYHSSRQCQILNPLSEARDQTHILTDTSQVHYLWATTGTLLPHSLEIGFSSCFLKICKHSYIHFRYEFFVRYKILYLLLQPWFLDSPSHVLSFTTHTIFYK